jgi:spermidine/putrescine transport system permease protein
MRRSWPLVLYVWAILAFLFAPVITVVIFSFSQTGGLPLSHLTTQWYRDVFTSSLYGPAFKASAEVGIAVCLIAVTIGLLAALAFHHFKSRIGLVIIGVSVLPIALPPLVLGIALISTFQVMHVTLSLSTVAVGHLLLTIPVVILTLYAAFANFDDSVEEAARDLGATPLRTFWTVTFPIIRPSVIGAALLVLAVSLDEFIVTLFTIGAQSTVPIAIWGQMRIGVSPSVNALSTLLLAGTVTLVVITMRLTGATFSASPTTTTVPVATPGLEAG